MRTVPVVAALLAAGSLARAEEPPPTFRLQIHWALQSDLQAFLGRAPEGVASRDTFLVRFAGVQMDATPHERVRSQIFADFSASRVTLYDAWVEAAAGDGLKLRAGKFQLPISEERLTPGIALPFVSTGFASVALPGRDTGLQLHGKLWDGGLAWNLALVNGTAPGTLGETDADGAKDLVARGFVRPFQATALAPLRRLGLGVGASRGWRSGSLDAPLEAGSIGTLLLVLGAGRMRFSDAAFTSGAADPAAAMQVATVIGGGLNWYPVAGVALLTSFGHMTFEGHRGAPARRAENALVCRFQMVL